MNDNIKMRDFKYHLARNVPQAILHAVFIVIGVVCLYPLALVIGISFSDETSIAINGFNLIPEKFSLAAYAFVFEQGGQLWRSYLVTIGATVMGTILSTLTIALYSYPLSRPDFPQRKFFSRFVFFTMLFSGGMVPWYIIVKTYLHLTNNFWALVIPYLMNAWYVMIMRTFFKDNVPASVIESAKMDGAGEYTIFFRIVVHLAKPGIATIALFNTIVYWNDWWLPLMLNRNEPDWFNLQYLMYRIQSNIQYLSTSAAASSGKAAEILARMPSKTAQMAMCVLVMGPIVLAYPFFQRYFVKGITVGSIKE